MSGGMRMEGVGGAGRGWEGVVRTSFWSTTPTIRSTYSSKRRGTSTSSNLLVKVARWIRASACEEKGANKRMAQGEGRAKRETCKCK